MTQNWRIQVDADPWKSIARPQSEAAINARRVDAQHPWGFFWAKDADGKCLLVLQHATLGSAMSPLPRLRGLEVKYVSNEESGQSTLLLRLIDPSLRDVFQTLCLDVVESTEAAPSEAQALEVALRRMWRWHHLLRGGSDQRLSVEEQKGLIGELFVLERYLLPHMRALDAVHAWLGPEDAPKDFQIGALCIEAKARRGSATPEIAISSESQLDTAGIGRLFLHVVNLAPAPEGGGGVSVADIALRIREDLRIRDALAADTFEDRLEASGLSPLHDYSDSLWLEGESWVYEVGPGFPRIEASGLTSGVSRVRYSIALSDCEQHHRDPDVLVTALKEASGHVSE
jgi:hypothetical protein